MSGLRLTGAQVLSPEGLVDTPLRIDGALLDNDGPAREIDLSGFWILPGLVDMHGDAFEKHLAPRRGAMKDIDQGLIATEAELAANGITTGILAQFYSWEGGMRGPEFAHRVFSGLDAVAPRLDTTLMAQLRFEYPLLEEYDAMLDMVERYAIPYVVLNDHLPHKELAAGKQPKGLTGKALRIGRNPEKHLAYLHELHARMVDVPEALEGLTKRLRATSALLGSHDDNTAEQRETWHKMGVRIAEFPETKEAAETAQAQGNGIVMGAPNLVRGGSHKGNVSALEMVAMGLCDALASDYHYPSLRRAAFLLADGGVRDLAGAWHLISAGPARLLGLNDRGELRPGLRADLIVMDPKTRDVCATMSGGRLTNLRGAAGPRFVS